jgi:hypothetical protein
MGALKKLCRSDTQNKTLYEACISFRLASMLQEELYGVGETYEKQNKQSDLDSKNETDL